MNRRTRRFVLFSLSILVVVGLAVCYQVGGRLLLPNRHEVGEAPDDLPIEDITIKTSSGLELSGWLIDRPNAQVGILLMHGSGQNRNIMVPRARFLHQAGYAVLLFDFRAHGESQGRFKTFGVGEHEDAKAALKLLKERTGVQQTAIIGFSLGGAAAILGPTPLETDAFVLEAVFPSIEAAVANRVKLRLGSPFAWTQSLLSLQIPLRTGTPLKALRPIDQISRIQKPIFLIAGAEDKRTTASESKALFEAITGTNKQFWLIPGANHTNFHAAATQEYEQKVSQFLRAALADTDTKALPTPQ